MTYDKKRTMIQTKEWTKIKHNTHLDVGLLHARYIHYAYPRHSHDYYVISLIERGRQSFTHKGEKYTTPAGGVILINPGVVHTGKPVDGRGFELRSLYPKASYSIHEDSTKPLGLANGFMLQILNPKLTVYAFTLFSAFLAPITTNAALLIFAAIILAITSFCATSVWALFGSAIQIYLHNPRLKIALNVLLSLSLVYTAMSLIGLL